MADFGNIPFYIEPVFERIFKSFGNSVSLSSERSVHTEEKSDNTSGVSESEQHAETGLISDLALILVVASITTVIFKRLKQPVVLGYIVAGFLVGPNFGYLPTVVQAANIDVWAELGIIFLLFSLGLEFSFKKLMNVGGSAAITALIIVAGMMTTGYFAGRMMGFSFISSLFLGGMLSMSSTTIILKALTDLNLLHRRFTSQVLAVLIVEDLFAVIMMVLLSSIAINNSVEGGALLESIGKLSFFLILWFVVGVYVIPSFLRWQRRYMTNELLLVLAVGLCFMMVMFSSYSGFSTALGAFVMGSILAGTSEAERIEKLISPVKDLFGAIFFVSVGMMVDPHIITTYTTPILILSLVVIVGMIIFGTLGMLVTGQPLRIAIESGFSLTQIGEFSFIIATLGMSLGVIDSNLYPIVVAVSVITTFFTPYFIKLSDPFSRWMERKMPARLMSLINRYSSGATRNEPEMVSLWKQVAKRSLWRVLLYSVLLTAILLISNSVFFPFMKDMMGESWGQFVATAVTLLLMSPFLLALCYPSTKRWEREKLSRSVRSNMPFIAMRLARSGGRLPAGFPADVPLTVAFSKSVRKRMSRIESQFMNNLNERELRRSGRNNNLVSDMHLAYVNVGYNCPFVGEKLSNSEIGKKLGVNVVSIQRGEKQIAIPNGSNRIFPGDTLGVIGTDEQIQRLLDIMEQSAKAATEPEEELQLEFTSIVLSDASPLAGKRVADAELRTRYSAMLVSVEHADGTFENPTADTLLSAGDNLWLVGDKHIIKQLI